MGITKRMAHLMLLCAAMCWGFAFSAQDAAAEIPSFTLGFCRSIIAGVFLTVLIPLMDHSTRNGRRLFHEKKLDITRQEWTGGILCGFVLALPSAFQQIGIANGTDGGKAAFITALYVVLVPVYSLFLKKKVPLHVWVSVGIALVGFYLLCIKADFSMDMSDCYVVLGTLLFPLHILLVDHYTVRCDGVRLSAVQFFSAAVVNLLFVLTMERPVDIAAVGAHILPILYLGIFSSGIAYTLQILAQQKVNPTVASLLLSLESVFGALGTAVFLHQTLTGREYIGCAIVFGGVILSQLNPPAAKQQKTE